MYKIKGIRFLGFLALVIVSLFLFYFFTDRKNKNVTKIDKVTIPVCAKDFKEEGSEYLALPFYCTISLLPSFNDFIVSVNTNGEMDIIRNNKKVLHLFYAMNEKDNEGNKILSKSFEKGTHLKQLSFNFNDDINFDGIPDLQVLTWSGPNQDEYDYYVYSTSTDTFKKVKELEYITEPSFDKDKQTISSFYKGSGDADIYAENIFHFENGKYVLIKSITQDFENGLESSGFYRYIEKENINNKMVITVSKIIKEKN